MTEMFEVAEMEHAREHRQLLPESIHQADLVSRKISAARLEQNLGFTRGMTRIKSW